MVKQRVEAKSTITKEDQIRVLFESGIMNIHSIHRKIQRFCPFSVRNVSDIINKLKNSVDTKRKERSCKGKSKLHAYSKKIKKMIEKDPYVDCRLIERKLKIQQTRQPIWQWIKKNEITKWDSFEITPPLSQKQLKARVDYCKAHKDDNMDLAMFDDETSIRTHGFTITRKQMFAY